MRIELKTSTGNIVYVYDENGQPVIKGKETRNYLMKHGINIPTSLQPDFQGKTVVRLGEAEHMLFHEAFMKIYVPVKINKRNEYHWVLVED